MKTFKELIAEQKYDLWYITVDGDDHNEWATGGNLQTKNKLGKFAKEVKKEYKEKYGSEPKISFHRADIKRIKKFRPHMVKK